MVKKLKFLAGAVAIALLFGLASITALAATPPAFTSAIYNAGTGVMVITGTDMVTKIGLKNDLDLSKMSITDNINHIYKLTSKGELDAGSTTTATITLSDKDKVALAGFLDKAGKTALNGGSYQVNVLSGWNGTTSTTDVSSNNTLDVSGIATVESATYDITTGKLVLTGTNMVTNAVLTKTDILPKYFTFTDGDTKSYTLTTSGVIKITGATQVTITLNAADQLAFQKIIDANGSESLALHSYSLKAASGWNGSGSIADMGSNLITASNYAAPVITLTKDSTVVYGMAITTTAATIKTSKAGSIYIVPFAYDLTGKTQADLDALVTSGTALKGNITNSTSPVSIATKPLKMTTVSAEYKAVAADLVGTLSSPSASKITINNIAAPALTATAAKSATLGTKVTATAGTGNALAYKISSATIPAPTLTTDLSSAISGGTVQTYTSNADITGVDATTNKYLGIYEIDASNKVVKFKLITLSTSTVALAGATAPTSIHLAVGSATPVAAVTDVAIPAAGATDTHGAVTGWVASTANKIKFTVTNGGSAASTIRINGSAYTSGADYAIASTSNLTIVVTTTETGKTTAIRTFKITVAAPAVNASAPSSIVLAQGSANPVGSVTNVAIPAAGATDTTGAITGWVTSTADQIKFTVTDSGSATSTITIGGSAYTSGADYTVTEAASLTVVVTTAETGKTTVTRTFTITVAAP